ncbi:hypothetical protein MesoLjLc_62400 [Mesorhizobium sp. L-8-10]|nr:hypothetical protein MesoLjLc_62400 [Mesorhizobium sp. L-8-10]
MAVRGSFGSSFALQAPPIRLDALRPASRAVQPKAKLGPVDDPLEREADQIAEAVIGKGTVAAFGQAPAGTAQRKCAECEEEETLRRKDDKRVSARPGGRAAAETAAGAVATGGMPMSAEARAYFEPRFGRDLSDVRIHTGSRAAGAANAIHARAYTLGSDIAFAEGEYAPAAPVGRLLLAHELAHVIQQADGAVPAVRRAGYGTGTPPNWGAVTTAIVPPDERERVDQAIAKVDEVVNDPSGFSECHDHFRERCPGGTAGTLASVWGRATIWKITNGTDENARGSVGGSDIAYTDMGYDQGAEGLAGSFLHEAGHNCGVPGGSTHWHAAQIRSYCMGPGRNELSVGAGVELTGEQPIVLLSYRRFLGDWASGRLRATLGLDLNVFGTASELGAVGAETPEERRVPTEFGGALAGIQARAGGWGGTRYGGFSFRLETGVGAGRFALRPATPEEAPSTAIAPAWILQVGPRAEFLIPYGDAYVFPLSVGAAYRWTQPLNSEAEALHGLIGSLEVQF